MKFSYDKFIVIVTYGRSGSTLLMGILNSMKHTTIRGENENCLFNIFKAYKNVLRCQIHGEKELSPQNPWYGADLVKSQEFKTHLLTTFINYVLCPKRNSKIIGFKEIRYDERYGVNEELFQAYVDFILNEIPNSIIIINTRNIKDVAKSKWWATNNNSTDLLEKIEQRILSITNHPRVAHVHYDDYVDSPEIIINTLKAYGLKLDLKKVKQVLKTKHSY